MGCNCGGSTSSLTAAAGSRGRPATWEGPKTGGGSGATKKGGSSGGSKKSGAKK